MQLPINLKAKSVASTIVYLPEYIRTLKSGFRDGSYETKLQRIREANILMIDDIGAEEVTPWVRDVMDHYYTIAWFKNYQRFLIEFKF